MKDPITTIMGMIRMEPVAAMESMLMITTMKTMPILMITAMKTMPMLMITAMKIIPIVMKLMIIIITMERNAAAAAMITIIMIIMLTRCSAVGDWRRFLRAEGKSLRKFWKNLPMETSMETCFGQRECFLVRIRENGIILTLCRRSMRSAQERRIIQERYV